MKTRKEVIKKIRDHVEIDCHKVYSNPRVNHMQHKFYMCKDAVHVVNEIKEVIEEYGINGVTVKKVDYIPPVDVYSIPSTSVTIDFPYNIYS